MANLILRPDWLFIKFFKLFGALRVHMRGFTCNLKMFYNIPRTVLAYLGDTFLPLSWCHLNSLNRFFRALSAICIRFSLFIQEPVLDQFLILEIVFSFSALSGNLSGRLPKKKQWLSLFIFVTLPSGNYKVISTYAFV